MQKGQRQIIEMMFFIISMSMWITETGCVSNGTAINYLVCAFATLIILFVIRKEEKRLSLKSKIICFAFFLFSIGMFVSGVSNGLMGNIFEAGIIGVLFPLTIVFTSSCSPQKMLKVVYKGLSKGFVVFFFFSLLVAPWGLTRYRGAFQNAISMSLYCVTILSLALYYIIASEKNDISVFDYIVAGASGAFVLISLSRGAIIIIAITLVMWTCKVIKQTQQLKKLLITVIVVLLFVPTSVLILKYGTTSLIKLERATAGKYLLIYDKQPQSEPYPIQLIFKDSKIEVSAKHIFDDSTSGRLELWKEHIKNTTLKGHKDPLVINKQTRTAHNEYIQLGYQYGLLTGVLALIINITVGIWGIVSTKKRPSCLETYFALISIIGFGAISIIESVYCPFAQMETFLYYVSILILNCDNGKEKENVG